jgi:elongin-C
MLSSFAGQFLSLTDLISGLVMEKIVEYFHYWYRNQDKTLVQDMEIPVDLCLELLVAADYLGLDSKPSSRSPTQRVS